MMLLLGLLRSGRPGLVNYVYDNLALERLTRLPGDWSVILRGTVQVSNGNLAPSEQMEFGDYNTVRGYETPLSSVDGGLRYTINTYLSVRFDYGFQLLNTGLDNDHGSRSDVGVVVSY